MIDRAIVLVARAPSAPGKSRLTTGLEPQAAIALRSALLADTFEVAASTGVPVIVSFTPPHAQAEFELLIAKSATEKEPASFFAPQTDAGDLGERMHGSLVAAAGYGASQVVLIGSDLPNLPAAHLLDAFVQLEAGADVVLGPADDGGYYLVGVQAGAIERSRALFEAIEWGSARVLTITLEAAAAAGLRAAVIDSWFDVDTSEDLARVAADPRVDAARETRGWLRSFSV